MRILRSNVIPMLATLFAVLASTAHANGIVSISWDRPAGPGQPPIIWRTFEGPTPVDVYVTVSGMSTPIRAQQVHLAMNTDPFCSLTRDTIPDAWRFDEGGCQAGRVCFTGKGLSELHPGPLEPGYRKISDVTASDVTSIRFVLAEIYPDVMYPDPAKSYTLFHLRFDHTQSVAGRDAGTDCGGAEREVYLTLHRASYLDEAGNEIQWSWGNEWIGSRGESAASGDAILCTQSETAPASVLGGLGEDPPSNLPACDLPVPAAATSWGRLKASYR